VNLPPETSCDGDKGIRKKCPDSLFHQHADCLCFCPGHTADKVFVIEESWVVDRSMEKMQYEQNNQPSVERILLPDRATRPSALTKLHFHRDTVIHTVHLAVSFPWLFDF
jgi:hypothetical protein